MTRIFDSGTPVVAASAKRRMCGIWVERPHGELLTGRVDDDGARLHERRDQPLLAVLALDHDAVAAGLLDRLVDVAAGAGLGRVELPERRLVGAEVGVREDRCRSAASLRSSAAGSSSYSTSTSSAASRASAAVRATTTATISPANGDPVDRASAGASGAFWSGVIGQALMQHALLVGRGPAPVSTATTLGAAFAAAGVDAR